MRTMLGTVRRVGLMNEAPCVQLKIDGFFDSGKMVRKLIRLGLCLALSGALVPLNSSIPGSISRAHAQDGDRAVVLVTEGMGRLATVRLRRALAQATSRTVVGLNDERSSSLRDVVNVSLLGGRITVLYRNGQNSRRETARLGGRRIVIRAIMSAMQPGTSEVSAPIERARPRARPEPAPNAPTMPAQRIGQTLLFADTEESLDVQPSLAAGPSPAAVSAGATTLALDFDDDVQPAPAPRRALALPGMTLAPLESADAFASAPAPTPATRQPLPTPTLAMDPFADDSPAPAASRNEDEGEADVVRIRGSAGSTALAIE